MDKLLSFSDFLDGNFLKSNFFGNINYVDILMCLFVTLMISLYIFYIYRKSYSGVVYSYNYNASLVLMSLITSMIIMTISSNLVLSLGMVGALSIVRFRTALKEPLDIIFMFWSIALGITTGAKLYLIAIIGSLFIGIVTTLLMRFKNSNNIFLLIVQYEDKAKDNLLGKLGELDYKIKSKSVSRGIIELTLELKLMGSDLNFIEELSDIRGVLNTSLVSYSGNFVQ